MDLIAARAIIPVHRCAQLIEDLTGASPSPGVRARHDPQGGRRGRRGEQLIRCLIILAHVVSADETPIRVGPGQKTRKRYLAPDPP